MLTLAALVLLAMTFTSCKAKIGEAKAKVKKNILTARNILTFGRKGVYLEAKGNTAQAAVSLWFLIKSLLWIASRVGFYFS